MGEKNVADYYDSFTDYQLKKKITIRHRTIFNNLINIGLKRNSQVLEIGCGIGTFTSLMARYIKKGHITAVDISPKSIEIAKKDLCKSYPNIYFIVSDMSDFSSEKKFDFIVLPDVLEHIPIEQHFNIFKILRAHSHNSTKILINIPSPFYLRWVHKHKPELLQIIDQPIDSDILFKNIYDNDFHIKSLNTYSLHVQEGDYQCIIAQAQKGKAFENITYNSFITNVIKGILCKIKTYFILLTR